MKGSLPKYCLHKSSGHARVKINGRYISLGRYGTPESRERYRRVIAEMDRPAAPKIDDAEGLTVVEVLSAYLRYAEAYYSQSEELANILKALRPLRELYGRTMAVEFGPKRLKAVRQSMVERGLCRSQINKRVRSIVRVFRWAANEELLPSSIPEALRQVEGLRRGFTEARESEPVKPAPDADVEATLTFLPTTVADMVRIQRLTGARPTEVCIMRPCDINRSGDVWEYRPEHHKNEHRGKDRVIYIGPKGQAILLPYLLRAEDAYLFSPAEAEVERRAERHAQRKTPMNCGNRPGSNRSKAPRRPARNKYDRDSFRKAICRACDKAGVDRWSPNRLRHAAATNIRQRFGLEAAQVALGHAAADVTQIYAERDRELARRVAAEAG